MSRKFDWHPQISCGKSPPRNEGLSRGPLLASRVLKEVQEDTTHRALREGGAPAQQRARVCANEIVDGRTPFATREQLRMRPCRQFDLMTPLRPSCRENYSKEGSRCLGPCLSRRLVN